MNGINKLQTLVSRFSANEVSKAETGPNSFGVGNKPIYQKKNHTTPTNVAHKIKETLSKTGYAAAKYFITSKKIQNLSDLKNKNPQSGLPASKSVQLKSENKHAKTTSDHISKKSENLLTSVAKQNLESKLKNRSENLQMQPAELDTAMSPQYPLVIDAVPVNELPIILTPMQLPQQADIFKANEKMQKVSLGETELSRGKLSQKTKQINAELGSAKIKTHNKSNLTNTPSVHIAQHRPRLPDSELEKRINSVKDDINKKGLDKKISQSSINNYIDVFRERLSKRGPVTSTDIKKMEDYQTVSQLLQDQNISHESHADINTDQELDIDRLIDEKNLMAEIDNVEKKLTEEILKNPDLYKA